MFSYKCVDRSAMNIIENKHVSLRQLLPDPCLRDHRSPALLDLRHFDYLLHWTNWYSRLKYLLELDQISKPDSTINDSIPNNQLWKLAYFLNIICY